MSATPAATSATLALRTRLIHHQRAAQKFFTVERGNHFFRFPVVANFGEAESSRLPGETVAQQRKRIRLHAYFRKQLLHLLFCGLEREIAHVQFLHGRSPSALDTCALRFESVLRACEGTLSEAEETGTAEAERRPSTPG
jgi:hypothetical protein